MKYIDIETYLELVKAKHNGTLREKLIEIIPKELNKVESEFYLINLWIRSLHENNELIHDCDEHGETRVIPNIQKSESEEMIHTIESGLKVRLKQPPFFTSSTGEQVLNSIESIITENETIPFTELSEVELEKLVDRLTLADVKDILERINTETVYMIYTDCCGETKTIIGFDSIMEVI